jgi:hypothetical protein
MNNKVNAQVISGAKRTVSSATQAFPDLLTPVWESFNVMSDISQAPNSFIDRSFRFFSVKK